MSETRYQEFVFRDGRFIGDFENMYKQASEVPWHQDVLAHHFYVDLDILILKEMRRRFAFRTVADVAAGLGHVTDRIHREVLMGQIGAEPGEISGFELSSTAVNQASKLFPHLNFSCLNVLEELPKALVESFDLVTVKDCLWYVLGDLPTFWKNLCRMSRRFVFVSQTFPSDPVFVGQDVYPNAASLLEDAVNRGFKVIHAICEQDSAHGDRESAHLFLEKPTS
ncbi:MAG: class I SAM-dependent methyltransferase [Deltaproteobacteria bacterium]|jgi:hypothetical protein|nr:class I SAM-dependent methyltransferase [Deltaproteobacteria bacterium]